MRASSIAASGCAVGRSKGAWIGVSLVLASCAATRKSPPELRMPALDAKVSHYVGSPLAGVAPPGSAEKVDLDAEHAFVAHCEIFYLEREPQSGLAPLASRARVLAAVRGEHAILPTSALATSATLATGEEARALRASIERGDFGRTRVVADLRGALPEAVTASFTALSHDSLDTAEFGPVQKSLEVELSRGARESASDVALTFAVEDLALEVRGDEDELDRSPTSEPPTPPRRVLKREYLVLADRPVPGDAPIACVFPSRFESGDGRAFAIFVTAEAGPAEEVLVAQCARDAALAERRASSRMRPLDRDETRERVLADALGGLREPTSRRASLAYLASETGAIVAGDLALCGDAATLEELAQRLAAVRADEPELGFALERATLALISAHMAKGALSAELEGLLARNLGELGRSASGIQDALATSSDLASLRARIEDENRVFLEDTHLRSRVRAYDWLAARGLAPAAYDPFASVKERRAALEAAEEASAASEERR